jgi:cobalt-zinc-cadmium efflux system protein
VLSAAGDTAVDSVALVLGLLAVIARDRDPNHSDAERWIAPVALINGLALLAVTAFVAFESIRRLREGAPQVHGIAMLIVSTITMVVLLGGAWILGAKAADEDVHMRSVLLDTLADAAAAAAIAVAGLIIALTGRFYWLDPVLALVIGAVVIFAAASLIKDAIAKLRGRDVVFDND